MKLEVQPNVMMWSGQKTLCPCQFWQRQQRMVLKYLSTPLKTVRDKTKRFELGRPAISSLCTLRFPPPSLIYTAHRRSQPARFLSPRRYLDHLHHTLSLSRYKRTIGKKQPPFLPRRSCREER